jgi:hypothetical protein
VNEPPVNEPGAEGRRPEPDVTKPRLVLASPRDEYSARLEALEQSTRWSRTMRQLLEGW